MLAMSCNDVRCAVVAVLHADVNVAHVRKHMPAYAWL